MPKAANSRRELRDPQEEEYGLVEGIEVAAPATLMPTSVIATTEEADEVTARDDEPVSSPRLQEASSTPLEAAVEEGLIEPGEREDVPGYSPAGDMEALEVAGLQPLRAGRSAAAHQDTIEAYVYKDGGAVPVEVPLLDAWYAQYASPLERTAALQAHAIRLASGTAPLVVARIVADGAGLPDAGTAPSIREVVIGPDDRTQITNTKNVPWNRVCSLLITAADGNRWIGTGWLIGPRTVITAGHCVYIRNSGGWVRSIQVMPGRNASDTSLGSVVATQFRSVRGWVEGQKRVCDYGAIILPENSPLGRQLGTFGYARRSDAQLAGLQVNLSGYPGDKPPGTQWYHSRRLTSVTPRTLVYDIDTAGGQSGAPVWWRQGARRYVVGIHTNGATSGNSATRIVEPVFKNLTAWKDEGA